MGFISPSLDIIRFFIFFDIRRTYIYAMTEGMLKGEQKALSRAVNKMVNETVIRTRAADPG